MATDSLCVFVAFDSQVERIILRQCFRGLGCLLSAMSALYTSLRACVRSLVLTQKASVLDAGEEAPP